MGHHMQLFQTGRCLRGGFVIFKGIVDAVDAKAAEAGQQPPLSDVRKYSARAAH